MSSDLQKLHVAVTNMFACMLAVMALCHACHTAPDFNAMHHNNAITKPCCYGATGLLTKFADVPGTLCLQEAYWR